MARPAFEEIVETFAFLEDWEARYQHVIELGKALAPLDPAFKVPAYKVEGCASQVWIRPFWQGGKLGFDAASDALIVQGLIALLQALLSGLSAEEVAALDVPAEFARLGLAEHLSAQRANGLRAMVARLRAFAAEGSGGG